MDAERERKFARLAGGAAFGVAGLSILYAISYFLLTPDEQRSGDAGEFFESYVGDSSGYNVASLCLAISGMATLLVLGGLYVRLREQVGPVATWALAMGVVAGFATATHGWFDLVGLTELSNRYSGRDPITKTAVEVARLSPSQLDPRGIATFGLSGVVIFLFAWILRDDDKRLSQLGTVLGVDLVLLFLATTAQIDPFVFLFGGVASLVLGPLWWTGVGRLLWREGRDPRITWD